MESSESTLAASLARILSEAAKKGSDAARNQKFDKEHKFEVDFLGALEKKLPENTLKAVSIQ